MTFSRSRSRSKSNQPEFTTIKDLLSYRLHRTANAISRSAALRYKRQFDVNLGEWRAIALLGAEAPLSLNDLARAASLDKAQMSRVVSGLVDRQLVLREIGGAGRPLRLTLTDMGQDLYRDLIEAAHERDAAFLACLTPQEHAVLEGALAKLFSTARAMTHEEIDLTDTGEKH